jgi:hypothetical protein
MPLGDAEQSFALARIREFPRLVLDAVPAAAIFRVGVLPTAMPPLLEKLRDVANRRNLALATLTRASGILYAAFFSQQGIETRASEVAGACKDAFEICAHVENNAQPMLEFCPPDVKCAVGDVWGARRPDFSLMQRIKTVFDPQSVLSPGRFAGGI